MDVYNQAIVIDIGASMERSTYCVEKTMTLTRTGCSRHDYWTTSKGGVLDVFDLEACQGITPNTFDYVAAGVRIPKYAGMIGNSISWNVLAALFPSALRSAGLCNEWEHAMLEERARRIIDHVG